MSRFLETVPAKTSECGCMEAFGQLIWHYDCTEHQQCPWEMRGVPIRCILVSTHRGDHK